MLFTLSGSLLQPARHREPDGRGEAEGHEKTTEHVEAVEEEGGMIRENEMHAKNMKLVQFLK